MYGKVSFCGMLFNSQIFVFLFLPAVTALYYLAHRLGLHAGAKLVLVLASLIFYGYNNPIFVLLLIGSIIGNYGIYLLLGRWRKKSLLVLGIAGNLALLFYFKYFNFFVGTVNSILGTDFLLKNILLPLGISFFTFQQISFVVDSYKKRENYSLLDYSVFVSFFPQLVAGPIVLHDQVIPQLEEEKRWHFNWDNFAVGIRYFVLGLFKKTMIADRFGSMVALGYENPGYLSTPAAALTILAYTLQIYFDFSGYSDMAIGLGKFFNLDIPINFDSPYKAVTIADFWKRWHMTMTGFFTRYLYIPLGGSRKGTLRTYLNIMIVFTLSGLWHGAAWTFVLWGMVHGAALVFHRIFHSFVEKLPRVLTGISTFLFVNLAWVLFRAEGIRQAKGMFYSLLCGGFSENNLRFFKAFCGDAVVRLLESCSMSAEVTEIIIMALSCLGILIALAMVFFAPSSHELACRKQIVKGESLFYSILAVMSVMTFTQVSEFLYFNF